MLLCEQTQGQTVYQHGQSVHLHYLELVDYLKGHKMAVPSNWRLPDWLDEHKELFLKNLYDPKIVQEYCLFHDCGKPFCRIVDEQGKVHFPNHAAVSERIWVSVGGCHIVGKLIGQDMLIHTGSAQEIAKLCEANLPPCHILTLLLVSLAEVHSNSKLFGGLESVSFKSKWHKIDQRGRQICRSLFAK